jgi:NAD dependent epimerase/dehydratase family enzyme
MRIAITGSRGLIGASLVPLLRSEGHEVIRIVRGRPEGDEITWNPEQGTIDTAPLQGVEGLVHLAGAGVGDHRWSDSYKKTILMSRVKGTTTLAGALSRLPDPPAVMVSASAVGYYGSRGDELLTEDSGPGAGFLADVC